MKKIALLLVFLFAGSANAAIINDFTGGYDVSNWTQSLSGGTIDLTFAPFAVIEISSDAGGGTSSTDFTIAALGVGLVSFDWIYNTTDVDGSGFDPFGWLLNGVFTQVTVDGLFGSQAGNTSFAVTTGDVFGFSAVATDSILGAATTIIEGFSAPVPEPTSLALLGLGLAAIGFARKKKAA